jgi:hypothetical protein
VPASKHSSLDAYCNLNPLPSAAEPTGQVETFRARERTRAWRPRMVAWRRPHQPLASAAAMRSWLRRTATCCSSKELTQLGRRRRRRAPSGAPVIRRQPLRLPACTSGRGRAVVQMKGPLDVDLGDSFRPQDYVWAPAVRVGASHWTAAPDGLARVPGQVRTPTLGVRSFPFLHIPTGNNITRRHGP